MNDRNPGKKRRDDDTPAARPVGARRERYLLAGPERFLTQLETDPATTLHRVIPSADGFPAVAVVEMEADRAAMLGATGAVHVEPDLPLQYARPGAGAGTRFADPGVLPPGDPAPIGFLVRGSDGRPLPGAEVYLMSEAFPLRGVTGEDGVAVIDTPAGALPALDGVYVKPRHDYWAVWLGRPDLTADAPNLITCPSFAETFPGFPERPLDGWARRALRFDALPPTFRGDGVRIAIIDSGAAGTHPDLAGRVTAGLPESDDGGWRVDTVGPGSHAAGIIGGKDDGYGIVGVVPEAELHACKIFPDGRFSDLIEALDYCLAQRIDVVNLSLTSAQPSLLVARKIEQARQAGIACVCAAGNSGGPVGFPASMPSVLAVAAIGKVGEYPPESYHATQVYGVPTVDGYFAASFSSHGPEIDVCAPGVAIVSAVPAANYAAWDGTSFAAPYVTGLAALLLAHHPELRELFPGRDATRVDRLFELIRGSCRPLAPIDRNRSGAGLPDAVAALGLLPPVTTTPPAHPMLAELWQMMAQSGLIGVNVPTVAEPGISLTVPAGEPLDPLRAAMRSAGLLPLDPQQA
ncbi:S8 family serine peptidase [Actinoplanes sp. L3-i22]|uniref:S8 family serine peptidase n=1 Tax=Actinoplanes sp. L3-i22 TaxID=2836373 RepID=UPI001C74B0DF|nr:S8 family serine peptidase [Actinoplanes sp. L3-i22]BCY07113.1 hypothetical protein L3i22_022010 [Actinoplanes sp. L3-i22]